MSKKTLHNVWLAQDKVPTEDPESKPLFFAGYSKSIITGSKVSRFEPFSTNTKTYNTPKKAKIGAVRARECYESPFIAPVFIEFAEFDVPEEPTKDIAPAQKESPAPAPLADVPESERAGWIALAKLCGNYPLMLRKKVGTVFRFAIAFNQQDIRYLPADEIFAWTRYFEECTSFVVGRIRNRRIAEGKDPDGADDWKKGVT